MAGGKSNYLSNALLNHVLGGSTGGESYTTPSTVYVGLWTAALSAASTGSTAGEVSGTGYARAAVSNTTTSFAHTSSQSKTNVSPIAFPQAGGAWGTITNFAVLDAVSAGNVLYWGPLSASVSPVLNDVPTFAASQLTVTES